MTYENSKKNFIEMINKNGSVAQETAISAMINWYMASSPEDAIAQIEAHPGEDLAGISGSVLHGIPFQEALEETDFTKVKEASATKIIGWLDNIHTAWAFENISPKRLAQKLCKEQLFQYLATANIPWNEVVKDYLFVAQYVAKSGNPVTIKELEAAFDAWKVENREKPEFDETVDSMFRACAPQIVSAIAEYRDTLDQKKAADKVAEINSYLERHNFNGNSIIEEMIRYKNEAAVV